MTSGAIPALRVGGRLRRPGRDGYELLLPERLVELNATAWAILELCDGSRTLTEICRVLAGRFVAPDPAALEQDVRCFLESLLEKGAITFR